MPGRLRSARPQCRAHAGFGDGGFTCVELVLALAIVLMLASVVGPATAEVVDASRARQAAGFMASRFRLAHLQAVSRTRSVGLVFDLVGGRWTFRLCADGNGNGLWRAELATGQDACTEGPYDLAAMFPGMAIDVDPRLPGPEGDPSTGDPVRFGSSDILSFSAAGTCTAGTLFLRSENGTQYGVRISNITARTRILRYETGLRQWVSA